MPMAALSRRSLLQGSLALSVAVPTAAWGQEAKRLNVYNFDTYIGKQTLRGFTRATGIRVKYDLYGSNQELLAKLRAGNPGYDVIFPSDFMLGTMVKLDLLQPLDHAKLPNRRHLDPNPRISSPPSNPGLRYGLPYQWGTIGIGYRKSKVKAVPVGWQALFDNPAMSRRIALLAEPREVLGCALKYLGRPVNSTAQDDINLARDLLIRAKKTIKTFAADNGQDLLANGEADLVMEYNGDVLSVMQEHKGLAFVVPQEGTILWTDFACIPKGAPHPANAHAFINHLHDPEVNAEIANTIHYATTNAAAKALIRPADLVNPSIYPPDELIGRSEVLQDVGDASRLYDRAWTEIQAA